MTQDAVSKRNLLGRMGMGVALAVAAAGQEQPDWLDEARALADSRPADEPELHRYYFKERVPLDLQLERIAVLSTIFPQRPALLLAPFGVDEKDAEVQSLDGWAIAPVPSASRSFAGVRQLADAVELFGGVDFVSPVFRQDDDGWMVVTPEVLVGFEEGVSRDEAEQILAAFDFDPAVEPDFAGLANVYRVRTLSRNGLDVLATANELAQQPRVKFAEPNMLASVKPSLIPSDPSFSSSWGLHNYGQSNGTADMDMDAPEAWDVTRGNSSLIVLVLDDGIEQTHPDLNQFPGRDFTTGVAGGIAGGSPINRCDNHGTAVAGCVAARMSNGLGTTGIAPNCRVASARFSISNVPSDPAARCPGTGLFQPTWFANALAWGRTIGARVTNCSYGLPPSATVTTAYQTARDAGIVHFAAAGNSGVPSIEYPAYLPTVNAVGAFDRNGNRATFSCFGSGLDFTAPGVGVFMTDRVGAPGYDAGDFTTKDGTSFASPYAAGVAALVLSQFPCLTPTEVESILQVSAVDRGIPGRDLDWGWGFINANRAVRLRPTSIFPATPGNVTASDGTLTSGVSVSWSAAANATAYEIWRSTGLGRGARVGVATAAPFVDTNATPGVTYYYLVRAMRNCLPSADSATNVGWRALSPPANVSATDGLFATQVRVTWSAVSGASHYRVVRSTINDAMTAAPVSGWQSATTFDDTTVTARVGYFYWVQAALNGFGARPGALSSSDRGYSNGY